MDFRNESSKIIQCFLLNAKFWAFAGYQPLSAYINNFAASIFTMLLIIPTIVLNGSSILTISKCSHLKEKISYNLIMLQSMADLTVGLVGIPAFAYVVIPKTMYSHASCMGLLVLLRLMVIPSLLSVVTLTAMTIERYIGVLHPLKHRTLVTKRRIVTSVLFPGLFYAISLTLLSLLQTRLLGKLVSASLFAFVFLAMFVYTRIFITIRKREIPGSNDTSAKCSFLKEVHLAKCCFLAVLCFVVCFFPGITLPFLVDNDDDLYQMLRPWATITMLLNSVVNSVIFFWTRTKLRKEACKILKCFCTWQK